MKKIKLGLPSLPYLRHLYFAFLKLIDYDAARLTFIDRGVELEAVGPDIRPVLQDAFKKAIELSQNYNQKGFRSEFPVTNNERKKLLPNLLKSLSLPPNASILEALEKYSKSLNSYHQQIFQSLFPFGEDGDFIPFQVFLLDLYALTRAPFFDSKYKFDFKLNIHQTMICIAGYLAARHMARRIARSLLTTLIFPINLKVSKYDLYINLRDHISSIPGLNPEEALILWFALKLPPSSAEDLLVIDVEEPGQSMKPISAVTVHLTDLWLRCGKALSKLKDKEDSVERLLRAALSKATQIRRTEADDAIEFVKLLYLAIQEGRESEKLELMLRASRLEASLATSKEPGDKQRYQIARIARTVTQSLF
ncbi:MAG: hypothetical protein QXR91_04495 [Nitrososphaerales archaeon]